MAITEDIKEVALRALAQMPPETRFREQDKAVIQRHKDLLLSWENELAERFYNTLFAHPPTQAIFRAGERPQREETLHQWWRRTVTEPIDEGYFGWMALVGLAHVVREVENPMMLAMTSFVVEFVKEKVSSGTALGTNEALEVIEAMQRLMTSVGAVITFGYDAAREMAMHDASGMQPALLKRFTQQGAERLLLKARQGQ